MIRKLLPSLLAAVALLSLAGAASAKVGVASAVEGAPRGQPPAGVERVLHVGIDMDADEKVTTGNDDRAHLVFLDGSSVSIGPNSILVIDKFVFNAETRAGDMSLSMSRGTMRFVGGVISKSSTVTVKTPSATIGVRGAIFTLNVAQNGLSQFNFLFGGSFSVTAQGVTQTSTQTGSRVTVPPGAPPSPPAPIPPGGLTPTVVSFQRQGPPAAGAGGQRTGVIVRTALAGGGLGRSNSGLSPGVVRGATPTPQQIALFMSTPRRGGGPGGPGGTQVAQRTGAGPAGPGAAIIPQAVADAIASGDAAAIATALANASPTVAAAIAAALVASNNVALITQVVVSAGTNSAVVAAVGTALGNSGNAALVTAVTASIAVAAPAAVAALTVAVTTANPTLVAAVTIGIVQAQVGTTNTIVFNPNQTGSQN